MCDNCIVTKICTFFLNLNYITVWNAGPLAAFWVWGGWKKGSPGSPWLYQYFRFCSINWKASNTNFKFLTIIIYIQAQIGPSIHLVPTYIFIYHIKELLRWAASIMSQNVSKCLEMSQNVSKWCPKNIPKISRKCLEMSLKCPDRDTSRHF